MNPTTEPLSIGVQIGLHVPVVLVALAGVLVALLLIRRLGVLAGLLGAAGSLLIAADQAINVIWVLHVRALTSDGEFDANTVTATSNTYTIADAVLITLGAALVVAAFATVRRRGPDPARAAPTAAPPAN